MPMNPKELIVKWASFILKTVVEHIPTNKNQHKLDKEN
jgi:hypothetical protein